MDNRTSYLQRFSYRQTLAIRKELLVARAALERNEFVQAGHALSVKFRYLSWIKRLWLAGRKQGFDNLGSLLRRYPRLSTVVSLLLFIPARTILLRKGKLSAKQIAKWIGIGGALYKAIGIGRQVKARDKTRL